MFIYVVHVCCISLADIFSISTMRRSVRALDHQLSLPLERSSDIEAFPSFRFRPSGFLAHQPHITLSCCSKENIYKKCNKTICEKKRVMMMLCACNCARNIFVEKMWGAFGCSFALSSSYKTMRAFVEISTQQQRRLFIVPSTK